MLIKININENRKEIFRNMLQNLSTLPQISRKFIPAIKSWTHAIEMKHGTKSSQIFEAILF